MSDHRDQLDTFRQHRRLGPAAEARIHARLTQPAARARRAWFLVPALALAAAAAGLFLRPAPPIPVDRVLADAGEADFGASVHARWDGDGIVTGNDRTMTVDWQAGSVGFEVVPDAGIGLTVQTGEARVRVVGTGFTVVRDAMGTTVTVAHGIVGVQCGAAPEARYGAGDSVNCLPTTPAALVGRARAQQRGGAAPADVLATLDHAGDATGSTLRELVWLRASELERAGRREDARDVAEAALLDPDPGRRVDLLRLATRLAHAADACATVTAHVAALHASGEATPCDDVDSATQRGPR